MATGTVALAARDLQLGHRSRRGGGFTLACRDLNLQIMEHEFVVIVGPSGCGKTTFLEAVAGLVPVAGGQLELSGKPIKGPGPNRSLVFQNASLFPWRTVMNNVLFGPQVQHKMSPQVKQRAKDLLEVAGLTTVADRYPHELSGGMRQRANLARALATDPDLLLLDEPTLGLDWGASLRLIEQIEQRCERGMSALLATNDVHLVERLGGRVLFLDEGRVVQEGAVAELLREVGGLHAVDLELRAPIPLTRLLAAPGVEGGSAFGSTVRLMLALNANPAQLLAALDGYGQLLAGMRVRKPDLGDAFLHLTGRPLEGGP